LATTAEILFGQGLVDIGDLGTNRKDEIEDRADGIFIARWVSNPIGQARMEFFKIEKI
jgi:hypothetical protein